MGGMSAVGVDIGGTWIRVGALDDRGSLLDMVREPLESRRPEGVVGQLGRILGELKVEEEVKLGVAIPAEVDSTSGWVRSAPNLGWEEMNFKTLLESTLGRPARVINDLNAITCGEWLRGAGQGVSDLLCVYVGTGVGMGIVSDGALLEGATGGAGELGHVKVEVSRDARRCGCGDRGCLEAYVSGAHLGAVYSELSGEAASAGITAQSLEARVGEGDVTAARLWERCGDYLALAIVNAAVVLEPTCVVLGGGVLTSAPRLMNGIASRVASLSGRRSILELKLVPAKNGDTAGVLGAGLVALGDGASL